MSAHVYAGLSAQAAALRRLETIAGNVANQATPGFRSEEVAFRALVSPVAQPDVTFSTRAETYISTRAGPATPTGNALDVAISGDAWFAIATPSGTAYTRDGRFKITASGELHTMDGHAVLDVGGATIALDPNAGAPTIARDGRITQAGRQTGVLGLFILDPSSKLRRGENASVVPDRNAIPQLDFERAGVQQGFIEGSNVNPVTEIARLALLQRTFDAVTTMMHDAEAAQAEAIRSLGST